MALSVGDKAPKFSLLNQHGEKVSLKDFLGQKLVIFFYPKDLTPGCTTEACDFQANLAALKKLNAAVLGISRDSVASHQKFAEKHNFTFSLLADLEGEVTEAYGVWKKKSMYGRSFMGIERSTFIIDEKCKITHIFPKVSVKQHVQAVKSALAD